MKKIKFNTTEYNFRAIVEKYLDYKNLEQIHNDHNFEKTLIHGTDQNRGLHKKFYATMDLDSEFVLLYRKFLRDIIAPHYDDIIVQRFPTFRVHQPNNVCAFGWHRDQDYNHNPKEINFFLPITKAFGTNTIWAETDIGNKNYQPIEADYGETIAWSGATLEHGNKTNETGQTRVSFDFRILEKKYYDESKVKESITKANKLKIGHYFDYL